MSSRLTSGMFLFFLFVFSLLVYLAFPPDAMAHELSAKGKDVSEKIAIAEGKYERIPEKGGGSAEDCGGDIIDVEYEEDDDNVALRIGPRHVFSELLKSEPVSDTDECKIIVTTRIQKGQVYQKTEASCSGGGESGVTESTLTYLDGKIRLDHKITKSKGKKNSFHCTFEPKKTETSK